jgi:TPR repeat protein
MQQGLANLELEPRFPSDHRGSSTSTMSSQSTAHDPHHVSQPTFAPPPAAPLPQSRDPGFTASYEHTNASAYQNLNRRSVQQLGGHPAITHKPSPFPKLINPGNNVPLSDNEKEEVLERARPLVLKSTDPEMQLAWAQDALSWVEVQSQSYARLQVTDDEPPRPSTPEVEHRLRVDALSIVSFLADQHHPKAEFMKGMWLEFGKFGYDVDKKEGFLAYRRAAERGYTRAEYRIGMQFESSNNPTKAVEYYQKGVAQGDSAANYRLGMMTLLGQHGAIQDYQRGIDLVRFAAQTADENAPQGAYVYGLLLARELPNINIPEQFLAYDFNEAKLFIEKAAYLGFAKAQLKMGQAYELCQFGCDFDPALSLHYNALAARQGESEADMAISKWFLCGYEGVFEKNEELAFKYAKRAAQVKMATAEFAMGYFYEIGMYVPIDLLESERWYQKAGEHGNKDALGRIDSIKKNNAFSKKDHEQIAISRIKSLHGSQRGQRPDRFKQRGTVLPAMSEDAVDQAGSDNQDPRRSANNLPASALPYPVDGAPPNPPYPTNSSRPSSAGGPQPNRLSSLAMRPALQHAPTEPYAHNGNLDPNAPLRLSTNLAPPANRGTNPPGRDYRDGSVSAGWEAQQPPFRSRDSSLPRGYTGQPQNYSGPPQNYAGAPQNYGGPPQNYAGAPQNYNGPPQNADRGRNRLQQGPPVNFSQPQPFAGQSYGPEPVRMEPPRQSSNPAIPRREISSNQFQRPERGSSMTPVNPLGAPAQRYPSGSPMQTPRINSPAQPGLRRPSPRASPQQGAAPPQAAPAAPPARKAGPATFEEMGIPAAKNESDCVSLLFLQPPEAC